MSPPRLRFAPSPTGYLHVGGARTALFNWLYARRHGGQFLLRVEDTDKARSTEESTRAIFEGLHWLGLDWDEDVVYQGANVARHRADAERLVANDHAYRCFCTAFELDARRKQAEATEGAFKYDRRCDQLDRAEVARRVAAGEPNVIRFRVPEGRSTEWNDLVHGAISFPNKDIEDFIILRSDGTPIYNMAVTSDDIAMGITLVMRGDDHISNTPKQIMLYEALGAALPQFAHLPMIHGTDGKKLSKRHGATAVADWQHEGILPQAMVNFLALLGWSPGGEFNEVMGIEELIAAFSADGLLKKASIFDTKKLEWMNGQHLVRMPLAELGPLVARKMAAAGLATEEDLAARQAWYHALLELLRVRSRTVDDIVRQARPYLVETVTYDEHAAAKAWKDAAEARALLAAAHDTLATGAWEPAAIEAALKGLAEARGIAAGKLFGPMRVALTGEANSPGMIDVLGVLGREAALARLTAALNDIDRRTGLS
ncbi:MAG: glutamate--tRNA ligase [Gemmatimonadetes bacterium]|nr:glutamate--tRNA ligase [Gemmatimonadota bacterium]